MNIEFVKKYLFIDDGYDKRYIFELIQSVKLDGINKEYDDLMMLYKALESDGLKSQRHRQRFFDEGIQELDNSGGENDSSLDLDLEIDGDVIDQGDENNSEGTSGKIDLICLSDFSEDNRTISFQIELMKANLLSVIHGDDLWKAGSDLVRTIKEKQEPYDDDLLELYAFVLKTLLRHNPRTCLTRLILILKRYINKVLENKKIDYDTYLIFKLYCQVFMAIVKGLNNEENDSDIEKESLSYLAYCIASCMRSARRMPTDEALFFAQNGLLIKEPLYRQRIYGVLGGFAISQKDWQLANDTYVTWLTQNLVGEIADYVGTKYTWSSNENYWRNTVIGRKNTSGMYSSLAHICGEISKTYEISSKQARVFYDLAMDNILMALDLYPENARAHLRRGLLLSSDMNFNLNDKKQILECIEKNKQAYQSFSEYKKNIRNMPLEFNTMRSNRLLCDSLQELIFWEWFKNRKNFCWTEDLDYLYKNLRLNVIEYYKLGDEYREKDNLTGKEFGFRDDLSSILNFPYNNNTSSLLREIHVLLISIGCNVSLIKSYLHRREYITTDYYSRVNDSGEKRKESKEIAYYTTLKNLSYIFDELYIDEKGMIKKDDNKNIKNTKNCLTVMNAKYMNDPNEGIVIIDALLNKIDKCKLLFEKDAKGIIKDIYDENFVFLKSFTEQIDKLTMWNRYANDYNDEGNNSNGCCALFNPESFASGSNISSMNNRSSNAASSDDYSLYRIVYLSTDGSINESSNPGLENNVYTLYESLKLLFVQLNNSVGKFLKGKSRNKKLVEKHINEILIKFLRDIVFLFKYDDYSDEQESRLVLFRNSNQQEDIRLIPGNVPLLALNPFFQVYIDKIIFGPNVRNTEKWRPYFQYELNNMWKKHKSHLGNRASAEGQKDRIDNSKIDYWT